MTTKEYFLSFANKYQKNMELHRKLNDTLLKPCDSKEWVKILTERNKKISTLYRENEKLLSEMEGWLNKNLDEESAAALYEVLMGVFFDRFSLSDCPIMINMGEKLADFYDKSTEYDKKVRLYAILTYWCMEYFSRVSPQDENRPYQYAMKVLEVKEHYSEMKEPEARLRIFRTYANLLSTIIEQKPELRNHEYEFYGDMLDFYNSSEVQAIDADNGDIREELRWTEETMIHNAVCNLLSGGKGLTEEHMEETARFLEARLEEKKDEDSVILWEGKTLLKLHREETDIHEVMKSVFMRADSLKKLDFEKMSPEENCDLLDEKEMVLHFGIRVLMLSKLTDREKMEYGKLLSFRFFKEIPKIPNDLYTSYVDDIVSSYFLESMPFQSGIREKEQMLMQILFLRQPFTYVHCLIVSTLSYRIAETIMEKSPKSLVGILGYESEAEILANREKVLDFVRRCGLLHDAGKIRLSGIINMQMRALTDEEVAAIRRHPDIGAKEVSRDKELSCYVNVIRGHHRFYDNKGGYPEFDTSACKDKFVIDIVAICDALENAEDFLGRGYKASKAFSGIIKELEEGSGNRYNPEVVSLISNDQELKKKLLFILSEGRVKASYEVYRNIVTGVRFGGTPYFRLGLVDETEN